MVSSLERTVSLSLTTTITTSSLDFVSIFLLSTRYFSKLRGKRHRARHHLQLKVALIRVVNGALHVKNAGGCATLSATSCRCALRSALSKVGPSSRPICLPACKSNANNHNLCPLFLPFPTHVHVGFPPLFVSAYYPSLFILFHLARTTCSFQSLF